MKDLSKLAEVREREGALSGDYPPDWEAIARKVKEGAGWKCERCRVPHGNVPNVLTVHHLDFNKWNCERWNLAALCQRCHLRIQARVVWYQETLDGVHSEWLARHIIAYNEWAKKNGRQVLRLNKIVRKDYSNEWKEKK